MDENKDTNVSEPEVKSPTDGQSKNEVNTKSKSVTKYVPDNSISGLNLFNDKDLIAAKAFLAEVMKTEKGGIKSVQEGLAVLMRAKDLNLPFSTCIEHIHVINGKTGIDIHIVKALLSRAGCTWRCTKEYQPLYEYTDGINVYIDGGFPEYVVRCKSEDEAKAKADTDTSGDFSYIYPVKFYKDFNNNVYRDYQLNFNKMTIVVNRTQAEAVVKQQKLPIYRIPSVAVDFVTEYVINRTLNGKEITATGKFSYTDAVMAEMFSKDTYKKYPKVLIGHRAFTYAAREIASDILFGVMETTELKIVAGMPLNSNDTNSVEEAEYVEVG